MAAVLSMKDRHYLAGHNLNYVEHDTPVKAVVFKDFQMPATRFDAANADVLIVLPAGYPDSPPDMFYVLPWLRLAGTQRFPEKADHAYDFNGTSWQRWSRHNNEWRPGVDGIWTMLKRVRAALEVAA